MSHRNTHSSNVHTNRHTEDKEEEEDTGNDEAEHQPKTLSVLSTDSGFEGKMLCVNKVVVEAHPVFYAQSDCVF